MHGKRGLGVIAALVGVVVGLSVHQVAAIPVSADTRTFTVIAKTIDAQVVDLGPAGPTHGDLRVFNAPLYNEEETQVLGRVDGFCTVTDPEGQEEGHIAQCVVTFNLPNGEITAQGVNSRPALPALPTTPNRHAITGGTEQYQTARGEIEYETQGQTISFTFHLILEP